jgi:hypothetical protein
MGDSPKPPANPLAAADKERAEADKATADARKAEFDLQQAKLKAMFPVPAVKAPEGEVKVGDKVGYVAELVAYAQTQRAGQDIASAFPETVQPQRVLVVENRAMAAAYWPFALLAPDLDRYVTGLDAVIAEVEAELAKPPPALPDTGGEPEETEREKSLLVAGAAAAIPSLVGAAADIVARFRTDYSVTSREVKMGSTPLVASVVSALISKGVPVVVDTLRTLSRSDLVTKFHRANAARLALVRLRHRLAEERLAPIKARLDAVTLQHKDTSARETEEDRPALLTQLTEAIGEHRAAMGTAQALLANVDSLLIAFDAYAKAVTTAPDNATAPLLAAALYECLNGVAPEVSHVLYVGVDSSGGEMIIKKGLFRQSGKVGFVGGCQVSYLLATADGAPIAAGTQAYASHLTYDLNSGEATSSKRITIVPRPPKPTPAAG